MKQEHEYAQVLRWVADGERVMVNDHIGSSDFVLSCVSNRTHPLSAFSLAPRTIMVNGREVPEPIRQEPARYTRYFSVDLTEKDMFFQADWDGDDFDTRMLQRGLIHLTKEAAITHAKAMLGVDG